MDNDYGVTPHERMARARKFAGYEQEEIAQMMRKTRSTISAWERGVNVPPVTMVALWAMITGRSIDWIMWGDMKGPPSDVMGVRFTVRPEGFEPPTYCSGAELGVKSDYEAWA